MIEGQLSLSCIYVHVHTHVHTHTYMQTYTHIHMYTHVHTHTYTHRTIWLTGVSPYITSLEMCLLSYTSQMISYIEEP